MSETNYKQATGTQGEIFTKVRNFYRKSLQISFIDKIIKLLVNFFVNILAKFLNFNFPKKYLWDWKLEMLLYKFEKETVSVFKQIVKPGMTVLDIGGHIGYYTRFFSKLVGSNGMVYVFEPTKINFSLLQSNTKQLNNVKLVNKAVGESNGQISFYQTFSNTGSHSLLEPGVKSEKILVDCVTLDQFILDNNITNVDVIKIDVEGAEPLVLKGAEELIKKSKNIAIIMELIHDNLVKSGYTPETYFQYLQNLGLNIYSILDNGKIELFDIKNYNWADLARGKVYINLLLKK